MRARTKGRSACECAVAESPGKSGALSFFGGHKAASDLVASIVPNFTPYRLSGGTASLYPALSEIPPQGDEKSTNATKEPFPIRIFLKKAGDVPPMVHLY